MTDNTKDNWLLLLIFVGPPCAIIGFSVFVTWLVGLASSRPTP